MAAGLARQLLSKRLGVPDLDLERHGVRIVSAGTAGFSGSPATREAIEALRELGCDITHHRSQPVTATLLDQADVVYAMTRGHIETLMQWSPRSERKIHLLDLEGDDVSDPIGASLEVYRAAARRIKTCLESRGGTL